MNRRIANYRKPSTGGAAASGPRLADKIGFVFGVMIAFVGTLILLGQATGLLATLR